MKYFLAVLLLVVAGCSLRHITFLPPQQDSPMSTVYGVPTHVQTGTYLWSSTEQSTSPSKYAPYLTYAYTRSATQAASVQAAGIKSIVYANPIMPNGATAYDQNELLTYYPSVIAKTCAGARITVYGHTGYLTDPRLSSAKYYYDNLIHYHVNGFGGQADYVFIDNASSVFYNVDNPPPCNWTAVTWGSGLDSTLAGAGYPLILNSLNVSYSSIPTYVNYLRGSNIRGGMFEECYNAASQWASVEESQLQTVALLKSQGKPAGPGFWCYRDLTSVYAYTVVRERMFEYASFLLTYDPNYSVFQESYATGASTFQVFPETGVVALGPQTQPSHYYDLKTSTGAYVQHYSACYFRGSPLGPCMVAANPSTTATVSLPNNYQHSMQLWGNGILDGGGVNFSGGPITSLGPQHGAILVSPTTTSTPAPTPAPTATPSTPTVSGTIDYISTAYGWFQIRKSSGTYVKIFWEPYTTWTNKSLLSVGRTATATGYFNSNGAFIASSISIQ